MKFRKKPVVIEAMQWTVDIDCEFQLKKWGCPFTVVADDPDFIEIQTLEGVHRANPFDWIIKGVAGEFYPCKPDIFEMTYEKVVE